MMTAEAATAVKPINNRILHSKKKKPYLTFVNISEFAYN